MALTDKLKNIADAVRTMTGKADGLTLDAMPNEILSISGSESGVDNITGFLSLSTVDVTIGANTVSNGNDALTFLSNLVGGKLCAAALLDNVTIPNQLTCIPGAMINPTGTLLQYKLGYRWRGGVIGWMSLIVDYDAFLVEGSRYRLWIADINETNASPY